MTYLNDPLFKNGEYLYNPSLAMQSYFLAISAFSSDDSDIYWGEDMQCGREKNVKEKLLDFEFTNLEFYSYDVSLNDSSPKAAFAIGKKVYNSTTDIVAIVVRGGNYGVEWADNFNLGGNEYDYHVGFYQAADKIKKLSDKYIKENQSDKKIKLWITGYSRGGAVANILASMYDNQKYILPYEVYAYTFAAPKCVLWDKLNAYDKLYDNIFNILSSHDPVYNVPPEKWGFGRFGNCVYFPGEPKGETKRRIEKSYYEYSGKTLVISSDSVNSILNIIIKSAKSRDIYSKYLSGPVSDFVIVKMSKYKNDYGEWVNYSQNDILYKMYGKEALDTLKKIKNNEFLKSIEKIGIYVPNDLYLLFTLCSLNGYSGFENEIFSNLNVNDISDITYISSGDLISTCHSPYFYRAFLENTPFDELLFKKG